MSLRRLIGVRVVSEQGGVQVCVEQSLRARLPPLGRWLLLRGALPAARVSVHGTKADILQILLHICLTQMVHSDCAPQHTLL